MHQWIVNMSKRMQVNLPILYFMQGLEVRLLDSNSKNHQKEFKYGVSNVIKWSSGSVIHYQYFTCKFTAFQLSSCNQRFYLIIKITSATALQKQMQPQWKYALNNSYFCYPTSFSFLLNEVRQFWFIFIIK